MHNLHDTYLERKICACFLGWICTSACKILRNLSQRTAGGELSDLQQQIMICSEVGTRFAGGGGGDSVSSELRRDGARHPQGRLERSRDGHGWRVASIVAAVGVCRRCVAAAATADAAAAAAAGRVADAWHEGSARRFVSLGLEQLFHLVGRRNKEKERERKRERERERERERWFGLFDCLVGRCAVWLVW